MFLEFKYSAIIKEVYDGDTITIDLDLGFYIHLHNQKFRLLYVDAPEVRGTTKELGILSRDALRNKVLGKEVIVKTFKDSKDKYGRWLCEIWLEEQNINQWLIDEGYAVLYHDDLKFLKLGE